MVIYLGRSWWFTYCSWFSWYFQFYRAKICQPSAYWLNSCRQRACIDWARPVDATAGSVNLELERCSQLFSGYPKPWKNSQRHTCKEPGLRTPNMESREDENKLCIRTVKDQSIAHPRTWSLASLPFGVNRLSKIPSKKNFNLQTLFAFLDANCETIQFLKIGLARVVPRFRYFISTYEASSQGHVWTVRLLRQL